MASASRVRLSVNPAEKFWKASNADLALVFVTPDMITSALKKHVSSNRFASGCSFWIDPPSSANFAQDLLHRIHPTALLGCRIRGIVLTSVAAENAPAEMLLLEGPKGRSILDDIIRPTNGSTIADDPDNGVLKILPMTTIEFVEKKKDDSGATQRRNESTNENVTRGRNGNCTTAMSPSQIVPPEIPACPVCIHRIDPIRFGLPAPGVHQLCTQYCPSPGLFVGSSDEESCSKQRQLNKWRDPARCKTCQVIDHYWNHNNERGCRGQDEEDRDLFCEECSMHRTLWVCLTCGFVGCGRYSNKHSVAHFEQTRHPCSLELATLRIWDYCYGEYGGFVERGDLLECPSSPRLLYKWLTYGLDVEDRDGSGSLLDGSLYNNLGGSMSGNSAISAPSKATEKSSTKVAMVGEVYEALLQSALEDQAQHFEDEITRLRAEHANSLVDENNMSSEEKIEIEALKREVRIAREGIEHISKELIEAQAQEAELRAASQRLMSEQKKSNELLKMIQEEHRRENEEGKRMIEELEAQINDVSTSLILRQHIAQNEELSNAQVLGAAAAPEAKQSVARRGKKKRRSYRK